MIDKKAFTIAVLSLSALILLVANLIAPRPAQATYETIQDNDYSVVTATSPKGGDAIYVTDKRSGKQAVFIFDPNRRTLVLQDVQPMQRLFIKLLKK
jgi:hypothetical protein